MGVFYFGSCFLFFLFCIVFQIFLCEKAEAKNLSFIRIGHSEAPGKCDPWQTPFAHGLGLSSISARPHCSLQGHTAVLFSSLFRMCMPQGTTSQNTPLPSGLHRHCVRTHMPSQSLHSSKTTLESPHPLKVLLSKDPAREFRTVPWAFDLVSSTLTKAILCVWLKFPMFQLKSISVQIFLQWRITDHQPSRAITHSMFPFRSRFSTTSCVPGATSLRKWRT